jgi:hypothetical protein
METFEAEQLEEVPDLDVRALKQMLAAREEATDQFRRLKSRLLEHRNLPTSA